MLPYMRVMFASGMSPVKRLASSTGMCFLQTAEAIAVPHAFPISARRRMKAVTEATS